MPTNEGNICELTQISMMDVQSHGSNTSRPLSIPTPSNIVDVLSRDILSSSPQPKTSFVVRPAIIHDFDLNEEPQGTLIYSIFFHLKSHFPVFY